MLAALRKFMLRHNELPTMLGTVTALLRVLALDVDSRHNARIPLMIYLLSAITIAFYIYTYHLSMYWFIFWRGNDDLIFNLVLFSLGISSFIGVFKLLYMYFNTKELKKLVSDYLQCDAAVEPDSRMSRNLNATLRKVKNRAVVFWLIIISNGVLYAVKPLLTPGRHLTEDRQVLLGLEPMFESPNYEIAFLAELFSVFLTVYAPANITGFVIIVTGYTEAQMLALSQEILNLWEDAKSHYQQISDNDDFRSYDGNIQHASMRCLRVQNDSVLNSLDFKATQKVVSSEQMISTHIDARAFDHPTRGCRDYANNATKKRMIINDLVTKRLISVIKTHAININLIKQVELIFQSAIAVEFTLLSIGLIAELLGGLENTYMQVPFAMVQVTMDCYTGQKLIDANKAFEDAVYDCKWEHFDVSNMKLVMVMLQNSQKTMKLSAGGVSSLSYVSLMSVIRSIYSAYTALRSTMK